MTETIATAALSALVGLVVGFFFKRWNREYVTKKTCDGLRSTCSHDLEKKNDALEETKKLEEQKFSEFKKEMREGMALIKGLLLVVASGGKVSLEDLKELMK